MHSAFHTCLNYCSLFAPHSKWVSCVCRFVCFNVTCPADTLLFKAAGSRVNAGFQEQNGNQCGGETRVGVCDAERQGGAARRQA